MDLFAVHFAEYQRKARGGGKLVQVVVGRLRVFADTDREGAFHEVLSRIPADLQKLFGGNGRQSFPRVFGALKIPRHQTCIGLAQFGHLLAGAVMAERNRFQASVGGSAAEERNMNHQ